MRKIAATATALAMLCVTPLAAQATPEGDLKAFREYYMKQFPGVPLNEFGNGVYAIDADARSSWEAIEEFPPYEDELERGKKLFETPFANGKSYASCFPNGGMGIRQNYPYFDAKSGNVKTLEAEINECRVKNGEQPLAGKKDDIAQISAYMASTSKGKKLNIKVPNDPRALAWYEKGKSLFYAKRGQLNMACADCHVNNVGRRVRTEMLGPALGHPTHFPVYRLQWGYLGTLQHRYAGCNSQVRAKAFKDQGPEYTALEYFETYMSNGIEVNGPSSRK
ncbi:MAG TPA: sulfur oxidation c-type cytochrome SoxA [Gammaproteobacteria bacterium]